MTPFRNQDLYVLWPMTDEPWRVDEEWLRRFLKEHTHGCIHVDARARPNPVIIKERGNTADVTFGSKLLYVDFFSTELLACLRPALNRRLQIGKIIDSAGRVVEDFQTLWSNKRVVVRGGERSQCWRCPTCGQLFYTVMGHPYLLRRQIPRQPLFLTDCGHLVVTSELHRRLSDRRWKKVVIRKIPVVEEPKDQFPADLECLTREMERST